jgi:hypothetical protein
MAAAVEIVVMHRQAVLVPQAQCLFIFKELL